MTGTADGARLVHLTAKFDSPVFADDAFPGAIEGDLARPHETRAVGYLCHWVGSIRTADGKVWTGEIADQYGGRLLLIGKAHGGGVTSLRAVAQVAPAPVMKPNVLSSPATTIASLCNDSFLVD